MVFGFLDAASTLPLIIDRPTIDGALPTIREVLNLK